MGRSRLFSVLGGAFFLATSMPLFGQAPALDGVKTAVAPALRSALEADAQGAAPNTSLDFHAGDIGGAIVFSAPMMSPTGPCRSFTLSTSTTQYVGRVCLAPATHRWTLAAITANQSAPAQAVVGGFHPPVFHHIAPGAPYAFTGPAHLAAPKPNVPTPPPALALAPAPPPPPTVASKPTPPPPTADAVAPPAEGASPAPLAPAAPQHIGTVDQATAEVKNQLQMLQIEYNKPAAISFDGDTTIVLVVESQDVAAGHAAVAAAGGQNVQANVALSAIVTAQLKGDGDQVSITPLTSDTQAVTTLGNAQWTWNVRAKQPGRATLTLDVFDDVKVQGQDTFYPVRTYTNEFPVRIGWFSWVTWEIGQIDPVWQFLGVGTPVVLIGGIITFLRRRRAAQARSGAPDQKP